MGENAYYMGKQIKIGTCEDLFYLRADQVDLIVLGPGASDPKDPSYRFRFPWPDEDDIEPGGFNRHDRSVAVHDVPDEIAPNEHYPVQFKADVGYLVSLPCPESEESKAQGLKIHRNGFVGRVRICQQRAWDGQLVLVCECACRAAYRLETLEYAQPIIDACHKEAEHRRHLSRLSGHDDSSDQWWEKVADRIEQGYTDPPAWVVATKR